MNNQELNQTKEKLEQNNINQVKPTEEPITLPSNKSKANKWIILAIVFGILFLTGPLMLVVLTGFLFSNNSVIPDVKKSKEQQWAQQMTQIQVLEKPIIDKNLTIDGSTAPCQPVSYDPLDSEIALYINDGITRNFETVDIGSGHVANIYSFSCASSISYVIDLYPAAKAVVEAERIALYSHVDKYAFSSDNSYLFLIDNYEKSGSWIKRKRIIKISDNSEVIIPELDCTENIYEPTWQGDRLMTFGNHDNPMDMTKVCIWSNDAKLIAHLQMDIDWFAASKDYINDQIGLLPNNHDILYLYTDTQAVKMSDTGTCSLFLKDITNKQEAIPNTVLDKKDKSILRCADSRVQFNFINTKSVNDDFAFEIDS